MQVNNESLIPPQQDLPILPANLQEEELSGEDTPSFDD